MFTKSQAAFMLSMAKLESVSTHLYFWTVTWPDVLPFCFYGNTFMQFYRDLQRHMGGDLQGLRVFEPSERGGLHNHFVCQDRIPVGLIRRLGPSYGIGRVQVDRVREGTESEVTRYLAKYLAKDRQAMHGIKRWSAVGGFQSVRVRDMQVESFEANTIRQRTAGKRLSYADYRAIVEQVQAMAFS